MIRTKDLIEYVRDDSECICGGRVVNEEYNEEIAARLERYDEMKEGIKKMIRDCRDSSEIDK